MDGIEEALQLLYFGIWLLSIHSVGAIFEAFAKARLVGQLFVGIIFVGLLGNTDAIIVLSNIGLILLVFEGGFSINPSTLRSVVYRASAIAVTGTVLPVIFGLIFMKGIVNYDWIESLASGASLASTSIAIATTLMQQHNILSTQLGALITSAAIIDDVLALLLLAILGSFGAIDNTSQTDSGTIVWAIFRPIVASIGVGIVAFGFSRIVHQINTLLQNFITKAYMFFQQRSSNQHNSNDAELQAWHYNIQVLLMLLICLIFSVSAALAGSSSFLGAFAAGICFTSLPQTSTLWGTHVKPVCDWLMGVFFSSIGFRVPIATMLQWRAFGLGLCYTIPAVLTKLVTGVIAPPSKGLLVGVAMVGRGELGFLLATQAVQHNVMSLDCMAITTWALLITTVFAPTAFSYVLQSSTNVPSSNHIIDLEQQHQQVDTRQNIAEQINNNDTLVHSTLSVEHAAAEFHALPLARHDPPTPLPET